MTAYRPLSAEASPNLAAVAAVPRRPPLRLSMPDDRPRPWWKRSRPTAAGAAPPAATSDPSLHLPALLAPDGVVEWEAEVERGAVVEALAARVAPTTGLALGVVTAALAARDALGPTHLGEGVDLPHARVDGLARPVFAVGLTRAGVADAPGPTDLVWLLLLPPGGAGLATTAQLARACRDGTFRAALRSATGTADVRAALARWERGHEAPRGAWAT